MNKKNLASPVALLSATLLVCSTGHAQLLQHHGHAVDSENPAICLSCHEGKTASGRRVCAAPSSHPVFIDYPQSTEEFKDADGLAAAGIRLQNGQVTCISCHNLQHRESRYHLAVENTRSRLCLTCHIK